MSGETSQTRLLDGQQKKVSFAPKPPGFELSHTLTGENSDHNGHCTCGRSQNGAYQSQSEVWAEELRRADDRCSKFKLEIDELTRLNSELENDIFLLNEKVSLRDQEITRLQVVSNGPSSLLGIRENFDQRTAEEKIISQERQIEFLNRQNQELLAEMNEIKQLVGIAESRDPTDRDRFHLKTLVRKLKQRND